MVIVVVPRNLMYMLSSFLSNDKRKIQRSQRSRCSFLVYLILMLAVGVMERSDCCCKIDQIRFGDETDALSLVGFTPALHTSM